MLSSSSSSGAVEVPVALRQRLRAAKRPVLLALATLTAVVLLSGGTSTHPVYVISAFLLVAALGAVVMQQTLARDVTGAAQTTTRPSLSGVIYTGLFSPQVRVIASPGQAAPIAAVSETAAITLIAIEDDKVVLSLSELQVATLDADARQLELANPPAHASVKLPISPADRDAAEQALASGEVGTLHGYSIMDDVLGSIQLECISLTFGRFSTLLRVKA